MFIRMGMHCFSITRYKSDTNHVYAIYELGYASLSSGYTTLYSVLLRYPFGYTTPYSVLLRYRFVREKSV